MPIFIGRGAPFRVHTIGGQMWPFVRFTAGNSLRPDEHQVKPATATVGRERRRVAGSIDPLVDPGSEVGW